MNIDDKMKNSQVAKQLEAATAQAMAEDSKEGKALSKEESETLDKLIDEHMRSDNPDEVKIAQKYSDFLSELKDAKTGFADVKKSEATQKSLDELNLDDKEQWTQIEAKQTKKVLFFGKDGYSFKTSNGVEVKVGDVDDIETVQVYENKQTGKVVVVNAKGAMIDSSADNADISIYNSEVEKIKTKSGVDYVSLNNSKLMSGALDKEDLAIENGDYLKGIDISKMPKVQSDEKLTLQSGEEIAVSDYIELITKQEVGFDTEKEYQQYAIQALKDNLESMKLILATQSEQDGVMAKGYNKLKELTGLGISTEDAQKMIEEQEAIIAGLTKAMNGEGGMSFDEAYAKYTGVSFSPEKIDKYMEMSNIAAAVNAAARYDKDYAEKFEKATGKSIEDINKTIAFSQKDTLGKSDMLQQMVEKYSQDQEGFADKLSSIVSSSGMVCIVAGAVASFIPGGVLLAGPLISVGTKLSLGGMLADNAIDLIDHSTDKDGLKKDEVKSLAVETGVEVASFAVGRGIGKVTSGLNTTVTQKLAAAGANNFGSKVLGRTAEVVADTAMSLGADFAISQGQSLVTTGEFLDAEAYWSLDRFLGEGKNQLRGILTGIASAKVSSYKQTTVETAQKMILDGDEVGARDLLTKNGLADYAKDKSFDNFVVNTKSKAVQEQTLLSAKAMILKGDEDAARKHLEESGFKFSEDGFMALTEEVYSIARAEAVIKDGKTISSVKSSAVEVKNNAELTDILKAQGIEVNEFNLKVAQTLLKGGYTLDSSTMYGEQIKTLSNQAVKTLKDSTKLEGKALEKEVSKLSAYFSRLRYNDDFKVDQAGIERLQDINELGVTNPGTVHKLLKSDALYSNVKALIESGEIDGGNLVLYKAQTDDSFVIKHIASRVDSKTGAAVEVEKVIDASGKVVSNNVSSYYPDGSFHSCISGDVNKTSIVKYDKVNSQHDLVEKFDYVKGENGEVEYVDYMKASEDRPGLFDITRYYLKDFAGKESEFIEQIRAGKIEGETLSKATTNYDDFTVTYTENYKNNDSDFRTIRNYYEGENGKTYSYKIENTKTGEVMSLSERNFVINSDESATSFINGKRYEITYDNSKRVVTLTDETGETREINIGAKFDKTNSSSQNERLWSAAKNLQADSLMALDRNVKTWKFVPDLSSEMDSANNVMKSSEVVFLIEHELGHSKDFDVEMPGFLTAKSYNNEELIKAYNKEWAVFEKTNPSALKDYVDYFSRTGGLTGAKFDEGDFGIHEFLAEANMLMSGAGASFGKLSTRSQLLVQNFPETLMIASRMLNEPVEKKVGIAKR